MSARFIRWLAASSMMVALLSAMLVGAGSVSAQTVGQESSFQVQNLSASNVANISITYYNKDGSKAQMSSPDIGNPQTDTVQPGESNAYFPLAVASGFDGSVVISSDQPVAVVSNLSVRTDAPALGSYVGFTAGASELFFPLIMKGNANQTSSFNVQNTSQNAVTIRIDFVPEPGGGYDAISPVTGVTIEPGAAQTFDQATMSQFSGITKWVGSAKVTVTAPADGTIAGVANVLNTRDSAAYRIGVYNAFTGGSTEVVAPLIQQANRNNRTSINCQNLDPSQTTTINVAYTPEPGNPAKDPESKGDVVPNGIAVFLQPAEGTKFVGSARITSSPAVPLACVINQSNGVTGRYSSYEGFNPANATDTIVVPLLQGRNGNASRGWSYSTLNVATVDGSSATFVVDYKPEPGKADPPNQTLTGSVAVFNQDDIYGNGETFVGGAEVTTQEGTPIVAIVNQSRNSTPQPFRDVLATYDGFNITD